MALFKKKKNNVGEYTGEDYKNALRELDSEPDDDFFGKKTFTESASTVTAVIKGIIYIAFVIVAACTLAYFAISFINDVFAFVKEDREVEVTIPEYVTSNELADILGDAGVIKHPGMFRLYAKLKKIDQKEETYKFVAGTYTVNENTNYDGLFLTFVEKHVITTVRITVPEGYTVDDIIDLFLSKGIGTREGWVEAVNSHDFGDAYPYLADIPQDSGRIYRLEGYLFPDTYDFYTGMPEYYYLSRMLDRFDEIFSQELRDACGELGRSIDSVLTVASIIEKEAYYANDYELVSQVLWNRLAEDSPGKYLECESTVIYAMAHDTVKTVTSADLTYASPYNSNLNAGLIPGPICNPSYNAIITAIYPGESSKKLYYFVTDLDKNVRTASTLKEHEQNIADIKKEAAQAN